MSGLDGLTLLTLRGEDDFAEARRAIEARGGRALPCPMIELADPDDWSALDDALRRLSKLDWIVFTSAHAARFFLKRFDQNGISRDRLSAIKLACIGPATERVLNEEKLDAAFVSPKASAKDFFQAFQSKFPSRGATVLLPLSNIALRTLPEAFACVGAQVIEATAYQNKPASFVSDQARDALAKGAVDWALFTSPSTVRNLFACLERESLDSSFHKASIGPSTSAALRELNQSVDAEADPHTFEGLLDAVQQASLSDQ